MFLGVALGTAFRSGPFPILGWLIPMISMGLIVGEAILLRPSIRQDTALRLGRILLLGVEAVFHLLPHVGPLLRGISEFPLGLDWLAPVLLWFLIREQQGRLLGSGHFGDRATRGE